MRVCHLLPIIGILNLRRIERERERERERVFRNCTTLCVAIEITLGAKKCVIFNVYMPYQSNDNEPVYIEKLGILKAIVDELDNTCYAIVGDWNANLLKDIDNSLFANHMLNFCSENNFKISSCVHIPGN